MKTTDFRDAVRLAGAITALGAEVPAVLGHLLTSYEVLSTPAPSGRPEDEIMDCALGGKLTAKRLAELAPAAAAAASTIAYIRELARNSEHTLLGAWHREIAAGAADAILDSLRPNFVKHAAAIEEARSMINAESSAEQILATAQPGLVDVWQQLPTHLSVVSKIGAIAAQFGCRTAIFHKSLNTIWPRTTGCPTRRSCAPQARWRPTVRSSCDPTKATEPHHGREPPCG
jgi:hypothetical protein